MTDVDGDDLANEGKKHDVVRDEDEIQVALLVAGVRVRGGRDAVRDEDERSEGVGETLGDIWCEKLPVREQNDGYQEKFER